MSRTVKSTRVGRPRAGEASDFEPRILARTWELFVTGGYSAITYEALSRLERMSKQTIYSRFESKEALFRAAAERRLLAWSEETARAIQTSTDDPLRASVREIFRIMMGPDRAALTSLMRSDNARDPALHALIYSRGRATMEGLAGRIAAYQEGVSRDEAEVVAGCIISMLAGHALELPHLGAAERSAHFELWAPRMVTLALRMVNASPPMPR